MASVSAQVRKGRANFAPPERIFRSSVADHTMQPKNTSATSGTITSRTKPDGQSAIDSSNVAIDSVKAEIAMAATSAARTDDPVAAVVVWGIASAMPGCSASPLLGSRLLPFRGLNAPLTISAPTITPQDGPPPRLGPTANKGL
jgi:hypothetical protein